jgi:heme-degrading monooxygenase HmoA
MDNKIVIGKLFVPKASIEEFRERNVTGKFLKELPGFVKGESYEKLDDSGNLTMVSVANWANSEAYENAQRALKEHYESIQFNPVPYRERLKMVFEMDAYSIGTY